ncbi:MAG: hypothetical protein KBA91_02440 [Candidatus Moranbacteria bacterium]|nr:hypothetical protein [Candidatus Moranbacteria bacterium]
MKSFLLSLLFVSGAVLFFLPQPVEADGIVPCGRNSGTAEEMAPCTLCHVVVGAGRLMQWGMNIMTVIAITVIVAMGILYIVSAGNQGMMQTAKGGMLAALIGFVIMLSAWLIVNIVFTTLADTSNFIPGFTSTPGVFNFTCDTSSNAHTQ